MYMSLFLTDSHICNWKLKSIIIFERSNSSLANTCNRQLEIKRSTCVCVLLVSI